MEEEKETTILKNPLFITLSIITIVLIIVYLIKNTKKVKKLRRYNFG